MRPKMRFVSAFLFGLAVAFGAVGFGGDQAQADDDLDAPLQAVAIGLCPTGTGGFWPFTWTTCPGGACPDGSGNTCAWVTQLVWNGTTFVPGGKACDC